MKKLIIAAVIVCAAAFAQAGSVTWKLLDVYEPDSGTAYLFNSATVEAVDAATILTSLSEGTFATDYAAKASLALDIEDGEISKLKAIDGISGSTTLWVVAVDDASNPSQFFVGDEITKSIGGTGAQTFSWFYEENTGSWTAVGGSSVPEPTSGMLLLLGMAGLALRRRRA